MANLDFISGLLGALTKKKKAPLMPDAPVPPVAPPVATSPYKQYQNLTLPPIGDAPAIDPRYVGDDSAMNAPAAPAVPASAILSPRAQLESQIADVQGRRYNKGVYRDDAGNLTDNPKMAVGEPVIAPGKDRDKKWSLGEKIAGALEGWFNGGLAGGIRGATDRNYFEKQGDQTQLKRLVPALAERQQIDTFNTGEQAKQANIQNVYDDNARQYEDLLRKKDKDAATTAYWNRKADQGDLKLADEAKLIELRDKWAASKDKNDQKRLTLVEKEMENRNKRSELDRTSRENIAGAKIGATKDIATLNNDVKTRLQQERLAHGTDVVKQKAVDAFKRLFFQKKKRNPTQAEIDNYINNVVPTDQ